LLEKRIWKSSIRLDTKIRLYQTYTVPVLLYGYETWSTTKLQCSRIDAFDMWALRQILRIPFILAVWRMWKSEQPPDAVLLPARSLTDVCGSLDILPAAHHNRTTTVLLLRWSGGCLLTGSDRYRKTKKWLRAMEAHLGQQNIGLASIWRKAAIRDDWRRILWTQQRSSGVCYERRKGCGHKNFAGSAALSPSAYCYSIVYAHELGYK